jgi:hypothetical protein
MTTFDELAQTNPNIRSQYDAWRNQRTASGENAAWWPAFREHVLALGATDPGEDPPSDWVGPDYTEPTH